VFKETGKENFLGIFQAVGQLSFSRARKTSKNSFFLKARIAGQSSAGIIQSQDLVADSSEDPLLQSVMDQLNFDPAGNADKDVVVRKKLRPA
jgi:hypothetical protein